jgi:hypothetical protein
MKPTREKRTTTQPGLGKVSAAGRRPTHGAASVPDGAESEPVPISAPPPSGGQAHAPRSTRALEKVEVPRHESQKLDLSKLESQRLESQKPAAKLDSQKPSSLSEKPASSERGRAAPGVDPRADGEPSPSGRVERIERVDRVEPTPKRSSDSRQPTGPGRSEPRRSSSGAGRATSKPPSGGARRGSIGNFGAVEAATGRRPISGTAGAPVAVGVAPEGPARSKRVSIREDNVGPIAVAAVAVPTGPARSKRVSIREDNLGSAVNTVADAVGAASRIVPKLLKTKAEIAAAPIDHRAGFLLAHVDGVTNVAGLVDICGMAEDEVEQILERLRRLGIVAIR